MATKTPAGTERAMTAASAARRPLGTGLALRWRIVGAVLPLLLLAAWGTMLALRPGPAGARIGEPAPDFALVDLNGTPIRLADLRGRPVIVNFWASWCGPCVEEFPILESASRLHGPHGLTVLGIVFRDNSEAARVFMDRMGASWSALMDPGEEVARRYGIYGPPETFFINPEGRVVARQIGQLDRAALDRHLAELLR